MKKYTFSQIVKSREWWTVNAENEAEARYKMENFTEDAHFDADEYFDCEDLILEETKEIK